MSVAINVTRKIKKIAFFITCNMMRLTYISFSEIVFFIDKANTLYKNRCIFYNSKTFSSIIIQNSSKSSGETWNNRYVPLPKSVSFLLSSPSNVNIPKKIPVLLNRIVIFERFTK